MAMSRGTTQDSLTYYLTTDPAGPRPTVWTLALHSGPPGVDGATNEVAFAGYARQPIKFITENTVATNTLAAEFAASTADYLVTHVTVWGGADLLVVQALPDVRTITAGDQALMAAGELIIGGVQ